eukprot:TRINITY_DN3376_c0_g1_i1.p1 TRINITY_DN3376_c0_g1~~TRINITY_DN3376_c0_g1_i1.p1  ORF type:complete len:176 (+),score=59.20 TRINITY_DN3376_c0_g1_i1:428-955(+)
MWNALWSGCKLLLLCIQQTFAFTAAVLLLTSGNDIGWFLLIVLLCNLSMIFVALFFCTKYEKLSVGLCCKLYCCCLYDLCPDYIDDNCIGMDVNKRKFNYLGFFDESVDENEAVELIVVDAVYQQINYKPSFSTGIYGVYSLKQSSAQREAIVDECKYDTKDHVDEEEEKRRYDN